MSSKNKEKDKKCSLLCCSGLLSSSIEEKRPTENSRQRLPCDMPEEVFERRKEEFLSELEVDDVKIKEIEQKTRDQSKCEVWVKERRKRLTASNFKRVCSLQSTTSVEGILRSLMYSKFKGNVMTRYGNDNEANAIEDFTKETGLIVEKCGLFIDKYDCFLAASPDGLINDDSIVEVKCPYSVREEKPLEALIKNEIKSCIYHNGALKLKRTHQYYYQVQGQLHITDRQFCYFIVWTPFGLLYEKIKRNDKFWAQEVPKLKTFYLDCYLPEYIDPRLTRMKPAREMVTHDSTDNSLMPSTSKKKKSGTNFIHGSANNNLVPSTSKKKTSIIALLTSILSAKQLKSS